MATQQLWPPVTVNRIVQTLIYRLAMHPLIQDPPIWNDQGLQVKINKFRNFDGLELKNVGGLTLSVFPYHYTSADTGTSLTVETENAALYFEPETLGANGVDPTSIDKATCNLVIKLNAFGFSQQGQEDEEILESQVTQFEYNYVEWMLRQYMELIAAVLRSNGMRRLPRFPDNIPLLANSFVKNIDFPTSRWENRGNSVLHSASILWQTQYYVPREWSLPPEYSLVEMNDGSLLLGFVKNPDGTTTEIFYDTVRGLFLKPDGLVVERSELDSVPEGSYLDPELLSLIDTSPKSLLDFSFFFKKTVG